MVRGAYILEHLMGTPPTAPPPGVEAFPESQEGGEQHDRARTPRAAPHQSRAATACHGVIDPVGLALENYNAVGQWRVKDIDAGAVIDASGKLADGTPVNGVNALRDYLVGRPDLFVQTLTENLHDLCARASGAVLRHAAGAQAGARRGGSRITASRRWCWESSTSPAFQTDRAPAGEARRCMTASVQERGPVTDCHHPQASSPGAPCCAAQERAVALPLLDAMIPAATALAKTAAAPKPRMAFVYFPHGAVMDKWTPKNEGADFDLPPILAPLEPFQKQLTIDQRPGEQVGDRRAGARDHAGHLAVLRAAAHQP